MPCAAASRSSSFRASASAHASRSSASSTPAAASRPLRQPRPPVVRAHRRHRSHRPPRRHRAPGGPRPARRHRPRRPGCIKGSVRPDRAAPKRPNRRAFVRVPRKAGEFRGARSPAMGRRPAARRDAVRHRRSRDREPLLRRREMERHRVALGAAGARLPDVARLGKGRSASRRLPEGAMEPAREMVDALLEAHPPGTVASTWG